MRMMSSWILTADLFLLVSLCFSAGGEQMIWRPQSCSLGCVQQGSSECEYCRITADDVQLSPKMNYTSPFGGCVPWPCHTFLGQETPELCLHYVEAPRNIHIEFQADQDPTYDAITVSWNPSQYGIEFLRGFQITLQALGGSQILCQLFLLHNDLSLTPAHAQRVYFSDPFTHLSLDTKYVVTVMALPVPERWHQFYQKKEFFTRTCPEKNGLEKCKKDWYPRYVEIHQDKQDILVTFNLAPENFKIRHYFSSCFGGGLRNYTNIEPDFTLNKTHHTYRLHNLRAGTNYTCEIAADIVDAVRKTFVIVVHYKSEEQLTSDFTKSSLIILLSMGLLLTVIGAVIFTVVYKKRLKKAVKTKMRPDIIEQYYDKKLDEAQCVLLDRNTRPPRLLICYSSNDGPAHIKVVLQLAAFLQKHMATEVLLDLWESLSIMEEGIMGWHCRRMSECDFVLVICSRGLLQNQKNLCEDEDQDPVENTTLTTITLIGQEMCRTKALGQDLSKYMVAIFEYSEESDIPAVLSLASRYTLTKDLPLLFSHLHRVPLHKPGVSLQVENISESGYSKLPAGAALQLAIQEAKAQISEEQNEDI